MREPLPTSEQVPSWAVTDEQLTSWGFPVEKREHVVGCWTVTRPGMARGLAVHKAWGAGFVRITSTPESVSAERLAAFRAKASRRPDAETMAWVAECKARTAAEATALLVA